MSLTDLIICYLSLAAPFGVFRYLYGSRGLGRRRLIRSVWHGALWPIFLSAALVELIATGEPLRKPDDSDVTDAYRHVGVNDLQRELELLTLSSSTGLSLFEIREVLERYVALTQTVRQSDSPDPGLNKDLFTVGGSSASELASICLSRKNLSRLTAHQSKARNSVIDLVGKCAPAYRRDQAFRTAQTLFSELGDESGVSLLRARFEGGVIEDAAVTNSLVSNAI